MVGFEALVQADEGRMLVGLSGRLGLPDSATLRTRLMECLAEQPDALLVDVAALTVSEPLALAAFSAVARQAARWPGIPVMLCAPRPEVRHSLGLAAYKRLPVYATVQAARAELGDDPRARPVITEELLPVTGAARQARNVATDACVRWDLPGLVAPASLIASELASNVVDHAHTMMTLRLALHRRRLHITVRDGSAAAPQLRSIAPAATAGGRGLMLVDATADAWGWLPCDGGKVVWTSLRVG
ncbi:ATP-binding protein [Couchioplanes caeruleus]|uniref:ATP-binding protein n=1 Tax=Couchioplanes caeruleus TaxID=56438 RepID=UPI0020BE09D0|nr:ATP-binding protein [Couchioplanes caeruleus]UQU68068.1 ATP-binding protein [Couchioplanes caeruleus]